MARYIFITGGVVSSLGKGLASAALGALLQARGYSVRLRKLDPYLNVDPGTMSPFEHGEVFVTDDGAETDLDLGHYERFTGVAARKTDSISSGRVYSTVLEKERRGDYLGKTIQVIPHVTNEIKDFLHVGDDEVDFMLCEIGGTVGDIEGLPFFEAIRQFSHDKPRGQCIFMHLTLLPYLAASGELKTKPTQHSVKELQSIGIAPDILVCRSEHPIPEKEREKIALFCNVRKEAVVAAYDLKTIYDAPLAYHAQGLDQAVLDAFDISPAPKPELSVWRDVSDRVHNPEGEVNVAIVGKYTQLEDAYKSIAEALTHGGMANRVKVKIDWVDAEVFDQSDDVSAHLEGFHAILVPGGFGERGTEGKIKAAQYAREQKVPYLGICLGMQVMLQHSQENGGVDALGLFPGEVVRFPDPTPDTAYERLKVPHMGWNTVSQTIDHPLWEGIADNSRFYFVHSYYIHADDYVAATADYGVEIHAALSCENVFAVQFHPEKSGDTGLRLLSNFLRWDGGQPVFRPVS